MRIPFRSGLVLLALWMTPGAALAEETSLFDAVKTDDKPKDKGKPTDKPKDKPRDKPKDKPKPPPEDESASNDKPRDRPKDKPRDKDKDKPRPPPDDDGSSADKPRKPPEGDEASASSDSGEDKPRTKPKPPPEDDSSTSSQDKPRKTAYDDDPPPPPRRKADKVDDEVGSEERKVVKEDDGDRGEGDGYRADWSVVSGTGIGKGNQSVWAEVGIPGVTARFLSGRSGILDLGGGVEVDLPGLNGTTSSTQRGLSALRLIGSIHVAPVKKAPLAMYLNFDPQLIFSFSGIGVVYLPVAVGVGLDMQPVHLGLDVGLAPFSANTKVYLPIRDVGVSPPFFGLAAEIPVNDQLSVTVRGRLQTFFWQATGLFNNTGVSPFVFGMLNAGVAYRF